MNCHQKRKPNKRSRINFYGQHELELSPRNGGKERFSKTESFKKSYIPHHKRNCQMYIDEKICTLCGLLCVNCLVWNPGPQYLQRLERLQRSGLKWITCRSVLGDKEYVESLIRNRLIPVSYFLVHNDLILLNKILVGLKSMKASYHWSITFGCPKTRSSEKFFIEARKTFRKCSEENYLKRVARFNNSLVST